MRRGSGSAADRACFPAPTLPSPACGGGFPASEAAVLALAVPSPASGGGLRWGFAGSVLTSRADARGTMRGSRPLPGAAPRPHRPRNGRSPSRRRAFSVRRRARRGTGFPRGGTRRSLSEVMNSTGRGAIRSTTHSGLKPSVSSTYSSGIWLIAPGTRRRAAAASSADCRSGSRISLRSTNSDRPVSARLARSAAERSSRS